VSIINDLTALRDLIINSKKAAFSKTVLIPEKEAKDLLDQIIRDFPVEFEEAMAILKKREEIVNQAYKEADSIKLSKDERAQIINQANIDAKKIIEEAEIEAQRIKDQTKNFIAKIIDQTLQEVKKTETILEESLEGAKNANI